MEQHCKIHLRRDQNLSQRKAYTSQQVKVFAPTWILPGIKTLTEHLSEMKCLIYDNPRNILKDLFELKFAKKTPAVEEFIFKEEITKRPLKTLQKCSRNLSFNSNGKKESEVCGVNENVFMSLHDLTRQCVIVGIDKISKFGGYNSKLETQKTKTVYVCDLAALQFQMGYHTGRLVLIGNRLQKGLLDDFIFENVVGEQKTTFKGVQKLQKEDPNDTRFVFFPLLNCFIDTYAYRKFVKDDVILYGLAVCMLVEEFRPKDKIHLKFLKYGTGAYAFVFRDILEENILPGVLDGLEVLLGADGVSEIIRKIELPFYKEDDEAKFRIKALEAANNVEIIFSKNDALKHSDEKELIVATTNCGDNLAPFGNTMGYGSVDSSIAENLHSKGNIFCPNINLSMGEVFVTMPKKEGYSTLTKAVEDVTLESSPAQCKESLNQSITHDENEERTARFGDNNRFEFSYDKNTIQQFHAALLSNPVAQQNIQSKLQQEIQSNPDLGEAWEKAEELYNEWKETRNGLELDFNTHDCHIALICYTLDLDFYRKFNAACRNLKTFQDFKQFRYRYYYETLSLAIFHGSGESPEISEETVLYRGMNIQVPKNLKPGDPFAFFHFTSTSVSREVSTRFTAESGGIGTLFEIRGIYECEMKKFTGGSKKFPCNVMPMGNHTKFEDEDEVLIRPFQEYIVEEIIPNPEGLTVVYLKA